MVTGILLLFACVGLGVVAFWVVHNDRVGPGEPTRGFLALRDPGAAGPADDARAGKNGGLAAPPRSPG